MFTNMTILKCLEYPCCWICSFDDIKVDIDWICTRLELFLQPEINEHRIKTENKYTVQRQDNQIQRKIKINKYVKITLIHYNEKEKQIGRMILD
jgi:hypothetical protein